MNEFDDLPLDATPDRRVAAGDREDAPARRPATLPRAIAARLRELITEGVVGPGARLNERALCERLGASRTPLREAFRLLAADGLVELEPNRGARVVALSVRDVRELFEVMGTDRKSVV